MLQQSFASGGGLVTMVRELIYMGGEHGKWNADGVPEDERLLRAEHLTPLEATLLSRIRTAGEDGSLWTRSPLATLLDAWAMWGERDEMRKAVEARLRDREELLEFVGHFVTHRRSHGMDDRVARTSIRLDPKRLADFVDVEAIVPRLEEIGKRLDLTAEHRVVLDAFVRGRKARAAGKDPRWADDFDEG